MNISNYEIASAILQAVAIKLVDADISIHLANSQMACEGAFITKGDRTVHVYVDEDGTWMTDSIDHNVGDVDPEVLTGCVLSNKINWMMEG